MTKEVMIVYPAQKIEEKLASLESDKNIGLPEDVFKEKCVRSNGNLNATYDILRAEKITSISKEMLDFLPAIIISKQHAKEIKKKYESLISSCQRIIENLQSILDAYDKCYKLESMRELIGLKPFFIRTLVGEKEFTNPLGTYQFQFCKVFEALKVFYKVKNLNEKKYKTEGMINFLNKIVEKNEDDELVFQANFIVKHLEMHLENLNKKERKQAVSCFEFIG